MNHPYNHSDEALFSMSNKINQTKDTCACSTSWDCECGIYEGGSIDYNMDCPIHGSV